MSLLALQVGTGKWVGDCFMYTNSVNRYDTHVLNFIGRLATPLASFYAFEGVIEAAVWGVKLFVLFSLRLNYYVGGEIMTICHLESTMFM